MSDLISRSALINTILTENQRCITSTGHEMSISMICDFILNQPTAYNVDAVVEQVHDELFTYDIPDDIVDDVVRKGGVNANNN